MSDSDPGRETADATGSEAVTGTGTDATDDACVAGWCADDDFCELTCAAAVVGKKWHPVIVHRLLEHGPMGFNRLKERIEDISATVLSDSLEDLQDHDVVDRTVVNTHPFRVEYSLTERGTDLEPVVEALETWSRTHLAPASSSSPSASSSS